MADLSLVTPGGRLIEGSMSVPSLKDYEGNLRDKPQYYFALAVSKSDPSVAAVMGQIYQNAITFYSQVPDVVRRIQMGLDPYSRFAWKISDGDHPKFADKPLYKGCYIFKFSSTYPLKTCLMDNTIFEPANVKIGWYADVAFTVRPNGRIDGNAGMFMNPQMTRIRGGGEEIVSGPAPDKLFANAPAAPMGAPLPGIGSPAPQGFAPPPLAPAPQGHVGNVYAGYAQPPAMTGQGDTSSLTSHGHTPSGFAPGAQNMTPLATIPSPSNPQPDGNRGLMPLLDALRGGFAPPPLAPPASDQGAPVAATSGAAQGFPNSAEPPSPSATVSPSDGMPSLPGFADGSPTQ